MNQQIVEASEKPALNLSLYHLDTELIQLLQYREERILDAEPPDAEELAAIDGEIQRYMQALPAKVDGVAAIIRMWRGQLDLILGPKGKDGTRKGGEIDRLKALAARIEGDEARLKGYVAEILEAQPEPKKGCKKLTGRDGSVLMLKGNGGVQPLTITALAMIPEEYLDVRVKLPMRLWDETLDALPLGAREKIARALFENEAAQETTEPSSARIREALAAPCPTCHGVVGLTDETMGGCVACANTGKNAVPGAHLDPRGKHVEVK